MITVAAGELTVAQPGQDHVIVTVEVEMDELLEHRAAVIAKLTGLNENTIINQALVTGLLLSLMEHCS
jgi:hypothetical protein